MDNQRLINLNDGIYKKLSWAVFILSVIPIVSLISTIPLGQMKLLGGHPTIELVVSGGTMIGLLSPLVLITTYVISKKFQNQPRGYKILLFFAFLISTLGTVAIAAFIALVAYTGKLRDSG